MRIARLAAHFLRYRFRSVHPFEVQAVLMNACNLKCAYCSCPEIKTKLLTTRQWLDTVDELAAMGTYRIKFQGGEPTMRKDFVALTKACRQAGMITAVITNGTVTCDQPELLDYLNEVVVSIDSLSPEPHNAVRGHDSHRQAMATLAIAKARGLATYVNMVVHRQNMHEIEPLLAFCEANGHGMHAQSVMFGMDYYDDTARALSLSAEEERALARQLAGWKRAGRGLMFSSWSYGRIADWKNFSDLTTNSIGASTCFAGKFYVHIDANGDVFPCVTSHSRFAAKNLITDGLRAALKHAQTHHCGDCRVSYLNERKAVFGLKPAALVEMMRRPERRV